MELYWPLLKYTRSAAPGPKQALGQSHESKRRNPDQRAGRSIGQRCASTCRNGIVRRTIRHLCLWPASRLDNESSPRNTKRPLRLSDPRDKALSLGRNRWWAPYQQSRRLAAGWLVRPAVHGLKRPRVRSEQLLQRIKFLGSSNGFSIYGSTSNF